MREQMHQNAKESLDQSQGQAPLNFGNDTEAKVNANTPEHEGLIGYGANQLTGDDMDSSQGFDNYSGIFDNAK